VGGGFVAEPAPGHIVHRLALVGNKLIAQLAVCVISGIAVMRKGCHEIIANIAMVIAGFINTGMQMFCKGGDREQRNGQAQAEKKA
jgi:hypothetical protein